MQSKTEVQAWQNLRHLKSGDTAPDFSLPNYKGEFFHLAELYRNQKVLLVFNLGFV
jgi:peroxiredoxin